jgi:hypothetical protein
MLRGLLEDVEVEHELADLLLQLLDVLVLERPLVLRPRSQIVFRGQQEPLLPMLDLGRSAARSSPL